MKIRFVLSMACIVALATAGCAGSSEEIPAAGETTPAAAVGEPATVEPTAGSEMPAPASAAPAAEPAPAVTPAAATTETAVPPQPPFGATVTHKVKDYDAWKTAFDADLAARKEAGILGHGVMRDVTNDKTVSVWLPAADEAKLKAFLADKALKDKMKAAGVQGKPEVLVMKPITAKMDPAKQGLSAAMVKATVKDFEAFKTAFVAGDEARTTAGIVGYGLAQDTTTATVVYLYLQSDDAAKLKAYVQSADTKKAWKEAGVKGAVKSQFVTEGEMTLYQ